MLMRPAIAIALVFSLSGCLGGGAGSSAASAIGAFTSIGQTQPISADIADAMAGGLIARSGVSQLDRGDARRALEAEYRALEYMPSGQAVNWQGRGGGLSGAVVAAPPYRVGSQNCRQYMHRVNENGVERVGRGTACRNEDGSWTPLV